MSFQNVYWHGKVHNAMFIVHENNKMTHNEPKENDNNSQDVTNEPGWKQQKRKQLKTT